MAKRVSVDRWLFIVTLLLVFVGLVMVFSASAVIAKERYHSGYFFLLRQIGWAVAGFIAMLAAMKIDYKRLKHPAVVFSLLGLTTLMLISVFFLDRAHNTHRWIHFGGFSFQPSELAKPVLILFLAFFLENRAKSMNDWRNTLVPCVLPTLVFIGLIVFQPDLGTAIACAAITMCILFVAGLSGVRVCRIIIAALFSDLPCRLPARPDSCFPGSVFRSAREGLPHYSIADSGFDRRPDRSWLNGRQGKIVLLAGTAHGFHLLGAWGGTRAGRMPDSGCPLCNFSVARHSDSIAHARHVRTFPGGWNHEHGGGAGVHQYQCGAGVDADQGHSSSTDLLRRIVVVHHSRLCGRAVEYQQAG